MFVGKLTLLFLDVMLNISLYFIMSNDFLVDVMLTPPSTKIDTLSFLKVALNPVALNTALYEFVPSTLIYTESNKMSL